PDRSVVELNGHAVRGIDRAKIGPGNPEAAGVIHPASGWLADLVDQVELPTILGDEGEARPTRQAARDAPIWACQIDALGRRFGCDDSCRHGNRTQYHFHCLLLSHCSLGPRRRLLTVSLQRVRSPSPLSSRCSFSISAARRLVGPVIRLINGYSAQRAF